MAYTVSMLNTNTNLNPLSSSEIVDAFVTVLKHNEAEKAKLVERLISELARTYKEYKEYSPKESEFPTTVGYLRGKMYGFETVLDIIAPYEGISTARKRSEES